MRIDTAMVAGNWRSADLGACVADRSALLGFNARTAGHRVRSGGGPEDPPVILALNRRWVGPAWRRTPVPAHFTEPGAGTLTVTRRIPVTAGLQTVGFSSYKT